MLLEITDLSLSFGGIAALAGVSLSVAEGETIAIIGPNGSGKTSLFNCITGIYRPSSGEIALSGESLLGLSPDRVTRRGVARTFQGVRLFADVSVLDNLLLGRHLHFRRSVLDAALGRRGEEVRHRRRCEEIIEFLGLEAYRKQRVAHCPFGVQKRVELGRALATEPRVLLLDEPASGLTAEERDEFALWIEEARASLRLTVLLVEHDLRLASRVGERLVALDHGAKIAEGTPLEVQAHPEVARAYLGA